LITRHDVGDNIFGLTREPRHPPSHPRKLLDISSGRTPKFWRLMSDGDPSGNGSEVIKVAAINADATRTQAQSQRSLGVRRRNRVEAESREKKAVFRAEK